MPKVIVNGNELFYRRMGSGDSTLVFIHGLLMDNLSSWWLAVANAAARHADTLCYDLRGHGLSERPPTGYTVADGVDDLLGLLDTLGIEEPAHLFGNSYGAVVAVAFAIAHPERVAGMVLIEPHVGAEGLSDDELGRLSAGLDEALTGLFRPDVKQWLETKGGRKMNRLVASWKGFLTETSLIDDLRQTKTFSDEELSSIKCRVLLVFGEESDIFERARVLVDRIPDAELQVWRDLDHLVLRDAPARVRELVLEWVRSAEAARIGGQALAGH